MTEHRAATDAAGQLAERQKRDCTCNPHMLTLRRLLVALLACLWGPAALAASILIENVTLIDGNGGEPQSHRYVAIEGQRISAVADRPPATLPPDVVRIDGRGKYLVPGFIDTNVHASVYGNAGRRETAVKYADRNHELVEEFAQRQLKYGVTTARDSYGSLLPLTRVRDAIERGEIIGSRLLVAGNILGWGGPFSLTFSLMQESELTLFQEQWNDAIAQGAGEELMDMGPEELRAAVNAYLDKGPDFIKYGGTSHFRYPSLIGFSPRAQRVIVEETHKRGLVAETHATSGEALRLAVEAGIDLIQHPEILSSEYPDDLVDLIIERDVICAMRSNTLAGKPWQEHVARRNAALAELRHAPPPVSTAEQRRRLERVGHLYELQRRNAERLIGAGCRVTIATDNYQGRAPEFRREPKPVIQEAGVGSLLAIEGLVELGMTPMQALVAATRNGAIACRGLDDYGTLEVGKFADLVLLDGNPLRDIRNIRRQHLVMARGAVVDTAALPRRKLFYTGPGHY
jgi:imidazolonepropionase-like amidohydrolase